MKFFTKGIPASGYIAANAVAKPLDIAAQAIMLIAAFIKPTSKPMKLPKAALA